MAPGFSRVLPRAAPRAACAGSASASQRYGGMFSAPSVPNFSENPTATRCAPRPQPSRAAFRLGAGVAAGGSAPGPARLGWEPAGELVPWREEGSRRGARCPEGTDRGPLLARALDLEWGAKNSRAEFGTVSSLCFQKAQSNVHLGSFKGNISFTYINSHTDSSLELVGLANTKYL